MTEPKVTTFEVSTINEYVDTTSDSESEYTSSSNTSEDTVTSLSSENSMSVVNEEVIPMPEYNPVPLEDVSTKAELLGVLLIFLSIISFLTQTVLMILVCETVNRKEASVFAKFLTCLSSYGLVETGVFMLLAANYTECCRRNEETVANCILPKTDKGIRQFIKVFMIIDLFKVSCYLVGNLDIWLKIAIVVYLICHSLLTIGIVLYSKKYCRCPDCEETHTPENVRIIYGNKSMDLKSKLGVTYSQLQEYFGILLLNGNHFGLVNAAGQIVYELRNVNSSSNPRAGQYRVEIVTIIPAKPEYSCADCGTCTPWKKLQQQIWEDQRPKTIVVRNQNCNENLV